MSYILSGILSGILSDILFGMLSGVLYLKYILKFCVAFYLAFSGILSDMCSGPGALHNIRSWQKQEAEKVDEEEGGERGEEGGVPLLKSRV